MFAAEYTPQEVCAALKLCKPEIAALTSNEIPPMMIPEEAEEVEGGKPFCVLCEFAMSIVEEELVNNRTLDMVERAVQMLCSYMPRAVARPCEEFVDDYGDKIIHYIVAFEGDPKELCAGLQLCEPPQSAGEVLAVLQQQLLSRS